MNEFSTLLQDKEQLIKEKSVLPLEFGSGSLSDIFDRVTMQFGDKKAQVAESYKELLGDTTTLTTEIPQIKESISRHIQRSLADIERNPGNVHLLNNLGNIYLSIGKVDEAIGYFKDALALNDDYRFAKMNLAKAYMVKDRFEDALKLYTKLVEKHPDNEHISINLAHIYLRLGQLEKAQATIEKLVSAKPENYAAHQTRGIIYLLIGKINNAISAFRRAVTLNVRSTQSYNALGVCYAIKAEYPKAIKYFKLAHTIDPLYTHSIMNLARAYQQKGDFKAGISLIEEYITQHPDDEACGILARLYFEIKDYKRSLQNLWRLASSAQTPQLKRNKYAEVLNNIGVVYLQTGLNEEAESILRKSIDTAEQPNPVTYFNLAKLLTDIGKYKQARELINEYSSIAPDDNTPLFLLSLNHFKQEEYEEARDILTDVLKRAPDSRDSRILLAIIYAEVFDDQDKALEIAREGVERNRDDNILMNNIAYSYLKKGQVSNAREILDKINWDKSPFPLYATRGLLKILEGNVVEGKRLYDRAVSFAPDNENKNLARQKRNIEVARYLSSQGKRDEAIRLIRAALNMKTKAKYYIAQANRLLEQVQSLPEQGKLPIR